MVFEEVMALPDSPSCRSPRVSESTLPWQALLGVLCLLQWQRLAQPVSESMAAYYRSPVVLKDSLT